jgi:ABC-type lipoprotein export system ATPase subunit
MVTHDEKNAEYAGRIIHFRDGMIETDHQNGKSTRHPSTVEEGNYAPE